MQWLMPAKNHSTKRSINLSTLTILQRGEPVLSAIAKPILNIDSAEIKQLIIDLKSTVALAKGVGIAAPQVGKSLRLFIMCSAPSERYPNAPLLAPSVIINPEIIHTNNEQELGWEGCLSVKGKRALSHDILVSRLSFLMKVVSNILKR